MNKDSMIMTGYLYQCKEDTLPKRRPHIVVLDKPSFDEGKVIICSCFYNLPTPTEDFQAFTAKLT